MKTRKISKAKLIIILSISVIVLLAIFCVIFANESSRNSKVKTLEQAIAKDEKISSLLENSVNIYNEYKTATGGASAIPYTPGKGEVDTSPATWNSLSSEQKAQNQKSCSSSSNDILYKAVDEQTLTIERLSGDEKTMQQQWIDNAKKMADWAICVNGSLYMNRVQAYGADDTLKSTTLQIQSKLDILKETLQAHKDELKKIQTTWIVLF